MADEEKDEGEKTPRPKRVRRAPKKIQSEDFAAFHESMPTLAPAPLFQQQQPTPGPAAPAVQLAIRNVTKATVINHPSLLTIPGDLEVRTP